MSLLELRLHGTYPANFLEAGIGQWDRLALLGALCPVQIGYDMASLEIARRIRRNGYIVVRSWVTKSGIPLNFLPSSPVVWRDQTKRSAIRSNV
jgi:hypothetical protein